MADVSLLAAEVAGDELCRALALWTKSHPLMMLEDYAGGLSLCDEAIALCHRGGHEWEAARVQVGRMFALINLGRFDETLRLDESIRPVLEQHDDTLFLARLDMNVGVAYDFADRYEDALVACERARERFVALGNSLQVARIDMNRAITYENLDRFDEALAIYQHIRDFFLQQGTMLEVARADFNMAILHFRQGQYGAALSQFQSAYEGFRALDVASEMDQVILYESMLYLELNLFDEVIERCLAVEQRFATQSVERDVILARLIRALAYGYRGWPGDREQAVELLREVRNALVAKDVTVLAAQTELEMAVLLYDAGRHEEALKLAQAANSLFIARKLAIKNARAQLVMANCLLGLGGFEQAQKLYSASLEVMRAKALPQLAYRCLYGLGRLAEHRGNLEEASRNYRAAMESIEGIRQQLLVDDLRASFLDDKLGIYADMVLLCLKMGDQQAAFEYAERAKARALAELLSGATAIAGLMTPSERTRLIDEELQRLRKEWNRLNSRNWRHTVMRERGEITDSLVEDEGDEDTRRQIAALEKRILRLVRQLQLEDPRRRLLGEGPVVQLADLQRDLRGKVALIEYFVARDQVLAFVVRPEGCMVGELPASLKEVETLVQEILTDLPDTSSLTAHMEAWHVSILKRLARLYGCLITPLSHHLQGCAELVIVPHGILYYLPFHALYDGRRYLLEHFSVSYAPSATVFAFCQDSILPSPQGGLLVAFSSGGRLPETVEEVKRIAGLLPEATVLLEQDATKDHLWRHSQNSRLLHIASHGTFRRDNPLFSSLRLADGDLTVNEVYHLRLNTSLVTLSACDTGVSALKGGDLIGLISSFFYAGARSLLVSLWRVRDVAAAELMERFYRRLAHGEGKAAALRGAQLDLMQVPKYRYPYYWAPFILVGDPQGPLTQDSPGLAGRAIASPDLEDNRPEG
jgi:CHAT domain-containing protein